MTVLPGAPGSISRDLLSAELEEHGAYARLLVRAQGSERITLSHTELGNTYEKVPTEVFTLHESYRCGPLKIHRMQRLMRASGPVPERVRRAFENRVEAVRSSGFNLEWTDLDQASRDERDLLDRSFQLPRAEQALADFRRGHEALRTRRRTFSKAPVDTAVDAALGALGYAQALAGPEADAFLNPPLPDPPTLEDAREALRRLREGMGHDW